MSFFLIFVISIKETARFIYTEAMVDYYNTRANYRNGLNVLGLVVFCIVFGIVVGQMNNENSRVLLHFFEAINDASIRIIRLVSWYDLVFIYAFYYILLFLIILFSGFRRSGSAHLCVPKF